MKSSFSRYLGIALLVVGIIGVAVTSLNNDAGFLADPDYYPNRPGGPPWSQDFGPGQYGPPQGWEDPQNLQDQPPAQNPTPGPYWQGQTPDDSGNQEQYQSNGESIYFSLITLDGEPILAQARNMGSARGDLSCAGCHGSSGNGGYWEMGRWSKVIPAIDHQTLSTDLGGGEVLRPAYTEAKLRQAITSGIDSAGRTLDYAMPRFQLSGQDLSDLINFLQAL